MYVYDMSIYICVHVHINIYVHKNVSRGAKGSFCTPWNHFFLLELGLDDKLALSLQLYSTVLLHPRYSQKEFTKIK